MATKKYLHSIDLQKNQILNGVLHNVTTALLPTNPSNGQVVYNTDTKQVMVYEAVADEWKSMGEFRGFTDTTNVTITVDGNGMVTITVADATQSDSGLMSAEDKLKLDTLKASDSSFNTTGMNVLDAASSVQDALGAADSELKAIIDDAAAHKDTSGTKHAGANIGFTPAAGIAATNVQAAIVEAVGNLEGMIDATLKAPTPYDVATAAGLYPSGAQKGDTFRIVGSGTLGDRQVNSEDLLISLADNADTLDNLDWIVAESNRDQATETLLGLLKIASDADLDAATDDTKAVTPSKLTSYLGRINVVRRSSGVITGDGSTKNFTFTHGLDTVDLVCSFNDSIGAPVSLYWETASNGDISIQFNVAPSVGVTYQVVVNG